MKNTVSEKYNIILIILLFVIPSLTLNLSFLFIAEIKHGLALKEQKKSALKEAEILASEADFSSQYSLLAREFLLKSKDIDSTVESKIKTVLDYNADIIFKDKISSNYKLYFFKLASESSKIELIYFKDSNKNIGKKGLCNAIEYLYLKNQDKEENKDKIKKLKSFTSNLLGKFTDIDFVAKERKGISIISNGINKNSWFVWDYEKTNKNDIYAIMLFCNDIDNYSDYGRLIALNNLRLRGKALGAFIPVYKDFGHVIMPEILNRSDKFKKYAKKLTINEIENADYWFKNSFKQGEVLGHYNVYCYLERGASHIAVVLVRSLDKITWPKWLIILNKLIILMFFIFIIFVSIFKRLPQISLTLRFALSYSLALFVPFSLICVTAYGYFIRYEKTYIDDETNKLQAALQVFDLKKNDLVKDYRATFVKAVNDDELNKIIQKDGINSLSAAQRVVDIFEKDPYHYLPILGVRLIDENGKGAFLIGREPTNINVEECIEGFLSAQVSALKSVLQFENVEVEVNNNSEKNNDDSIENNLANIGFNSVMGNDLDEGMARHTSLPIPRKNGEYNSYHIFDYIKIDGKPRYILFVMWDNQTLDDKLIKKSFHEYNASRENIEHNFIAYKIFEHEVKKIATNTREVNNDKNIIDKTEELARFSYNVKKSDIYVDDNNIFVSMPSFNFNKTVFVGWISRFKIVKNIFYRKFIMLSLVLFSLAILLICSLRSVAVFLKPVSSLKKALDEVSVGNYNIGLINAPNDEIGILSDEFTKMIDGLQERERLSKLISEQAVKALEKNSSGVLSDTETFKGVALVSDIRNFTGMSEKYEPTLITDLLNEHFAEMTKIISDNGGYIYKYIGDAIEAVFPENNELTKSVFERAFNAGCLMIAKLEDINNRRLKNDLFTYRIGVGLCSGEMYSGSVGSIETRLDYSILGVPLKKAAKLEALSIQNPSFPLVIDEKIYKEVSNFGFSFKNIDSKELNINLYSLEGKKEEIIKNVHIKYDNLSIMKDDEIKNKEIEYFSLSNEKKYSELFAYLKVIVIVFILSLLITSGFYAVYLTTFNNAKAESEKYCNRLIKQLQCDEVFKSAFETLCFDFYDDIISLVESNDTINFNEKVKKICKKYEEKSVSIPKICCLLFKSGDLGKHYNENRKSDYIEGFYSHGFSVDTFKKLTDYAITERLLDYESRKKYYKALIGDVVDIYYMRSFYYRRSSAVQLDDENLYFNTNKIFDKKRENFKAFVFCCIPINYDKNLIEYYKLLAGNDILLAFNKGNTWNFSNQFSNEQQKLLKKYISNLDELKKFGYTKDQIKIGEEYWNVICISKDLASIYHSEFNYIFLVFSISFCVLGILIYFIRKNNIKFHGSISSKLRYYILSASFLPLFTVVFLSNLFVIEDYTVKKSELRYELNNLMNEIERKELYYQPFCINILKDFSKNDLPIKLKNNTKEVIEKYVKYNISERNSIRNTGIDPHFQVRDFLISGKKDYIATVRYERGKGFIQSELSEFSKILNELAHVVFLKEEKSDEIRNAKSVMITDKFLEMLATYFGSDLTLKVVNFPNNIIWVSVSSSVIGIYITPLPNIENPDYIGFYIIFFDNENRSDACKMYNMGDYYVRVKKGDEKKKEEIENNEYYPFEKRFKSTLRTDKLYCFASPIINVGENFFFEDNDDNLFNKREDLKAVKELGLASSWLNSSFAPLSRKIDLYGPNFLEMKRGDYLNDTIYAAIGSEYPIKNDNNQKIYIFIIVITLSILLNLVIIYIVNSDLLEPVNLLMVGAKLASKGDYSFRIISDRQDELGILCDSFNKMMKGLEEKLLMNRMVSKTALSVTSTTKDISSKKENVFLLYVTVPGFDKVMKELSTSDLFMKLRKQISTIAEIILKEGGDIDKIMGEKLLIVFHINDRNLEDVAYSACNAAKRIENSEKLDFKVSVGVNYGQVISGFLGVGEKRDFTVIGDPVNVTARIAVFAEKLESSRRIVSEQVMKIAKNNVKMEEYGEILFKGKSLPSKVYRII